MELVSNRTERKILENIFELNSLPDNFNFELNGIQIVKPNLKIIDDIIVFKSFLGMIFGTGFSPKIEKYNIDVNEQEDLFNNDVLLELQQCKNTGEQKNIFDYYI